MCTIENHQQSLQDFFQLVLMIYHFLKSDQIFLLFCKLLSNIFNFDSTDRTHVKCQLLYTLSVLKFKVLRLVALCWFQEYFFLQTLTMPNTNMYCKNFSLSEYNQFLDTQRHLFDNYSCHDSYSKKWQNVSGMFRHLPVIVFLT